MGKRVKTRATRTRNKVKAKAHAAIRKTPADTRPATDTTQGDTLGWLKTQDADGPHR